MTRSRVKQYVRMWQSRCYSDDIPDEAPNEIADKVPSYKRIAIAILKNDLHLSSLGFSRPQSEYYSILKRIEIEGRINNGENIKMKPEKKPQPMSFQKQAEIEFIRSKIPYESNVYFSRKSLAPDERKELPLSCTITAIDDFSISLYASGVTNTYKHSDISKICPAGIELPKEIPMSADNQ